MHFLIQLDLLRQKEQLSLKRIICMREDDDFIAKLLPLRFRPNFPTNSHIQWTQKFPGSKWQKSNKCFKCKQKLRIFTFFMQKLSKTFCCYGAMALSKVTNFQFDIFIFKTIMSLQTLLSFWSKKAEIQPMHCNFGLPSSLQ